MTDITPEFNLCLKEKHGSPILRKDYDLEKINSFLQEAYSINTRITELTRELRLIRPRYLSTAPATAHRRRQSAAGGVNHDRTRPLTDKERDELDAQSKLLLRQLNGAITGLRAAENARTQTADSVALSKRAKGGLSALGRWAAGGAVTAKSPEEEQEEAERKTVAAVRESIILFLSTKLEEAGRVQGGMMDARLSREVEKSKSMLAQSSIPGGVPHMAGYSGISGVADSSKRKRSFGDHATVADDVSFQQELSQEQMQAFAEENHELLRHYEDQLDQVRTAERSILEISELHSTLHANLTMQSENIEQLVQDSYLTTENLGRGNKELKKASERRSTAQAVFYSTAAFCSFLIVWDLVF